MEDRLFHLLDAYLENRLSNAESAELAEILRATPESRRAFWAYFEQHAMIEEILGEARGRDLAHFDQGENPKDIPAAAISQTAAARPALNGRSLDWRWGAAVVALATGLLIALGLRMDRGGHETNHEPTSLAVVQSVAGEMEVADASGVSAPLAPGADLFAGQTVRVGEQESRGEVQFADGTQVKLTAGTSIRLLSEGAEGGRKFHLERGAIQVQSPNVPSAQPLVVTTDHARVAAGKTRFRLYREANASRVELAEGEARLLRPEGDAAVDMAEGSFVVVADALQPMTPQSLPDDQCRLRHTFLNAGDAVQFSTDGGYAVTSHFGRGWKTWNLSDGSVRSVAPGASQRTDDLTFTAAPDTVIALGNRGTATFWKTTGPRPIETSLRTQHLRRGAISDNGRWLAQGTSSGEVAIWEADAERTSISLRRTLPIKPTRVAFSTAGPYIAVSQWGGAIQLFEVKTGRQVDQCKLSRTPTPLALSADSSFLAAYANSDGLILFDRQRRNRHALWPGQGGRISHLHFTSDGQVLLAGLNDGTVRAWSTANGRLLLVLETGHRHVSQVTTTRDLSLLATVGDNDCVKIWECKSLHSGARQAIRSAPDRRLSIGSNI